MMTVAEYNSKVQELDELEAELTQLEKDKLGGTMPTDPTQLSGIGTSTQPRTQEEWDNLPANPETGYVPPPPLEQPPVAAQPSQSLPMMSAHEPASGLGGTNVSLSGREVKKPTMNSLSDLTGVMVGDTEKQGMVENIARDAAVQIMGLTPVGVAQLIEGLTTDPLGNLGGMGKSIAETYDRFFRSGVLHDPAATLELSQELSKRPFSELMNLVMPLGLVVGGKAIAGKFKGKPVVPEVTPTELPLDLQKPTIPVEPPPQTAPVEAKAITPPVETPKPEMPVEPPTKPVVAPQEARALETPATAEASLQPAVPEAGMKRPVRNQEILDAVTRKLNDGEPVILSTHLKSWKITKPEHLRVNKAGELQIIRGKNWDTISEGYAENLAKQTGLKPIDRFAGMDEIIDYSTPDPALKAIGGKQAVNQETNFQKGDRVYFQTENLRKPHRGRIADIIKLPGQPVKYQIFTMTASKDTYFVTADKLKLPTKTIRLREYHAAFAEVPKAERAKVKVDAKLFDELLQEHYEIIDPTNEAPGVFQTVRDQTGKEFAGMSASLDRYRELAADALGVKDFYNPVERAKALPKLEKFIESKKVDLPAAVKSSSPMTDDRFAVSAVGKKVNMAELDAKVGDKIKLQDNDWYDIEPSDTPGNFKLKDGRTLEIDDTFEAIDVKQIARRELKYEKTTAGDQGLLAGTEGRTVPTGTLKTVGGKVNAPINQGDVFNPDKIAVGNLPQDQVNMFGKQAADAGKVTETGITKAVAAVPELSFLDKIEASARERLAGRQGKTSLGALGDPKAALDLTDHAVIGAVKLARGTIKFADWSAEMLKEFGDEIKPHLQKIWRQSRQFHEKIKAGEDPIGTSVAVTEKAPVEVPKPESNLVSLRKRDAEKIYEDLTGQKMNPTEKRGWDEDYAKVETEGIDKDIHSILRTAAENHRPISSTEHVAAVKRLVDLKNEIIDATAQKEATRVIDLVDQQREFLEDVAASRSEWGRSGAIGKLGIDKTTKTIGMVLDAVRESKGSKLTPGDVTRFTDQHNRIVELEKQLDAERVNSAKVTLERDKAIAGRVAEVEIRKAKIQERTVALKDKLVAERATLEKQLAEMGNRTSFIVGPPPDAMYVAGKIAVNLFKEGATSLQEVVTKMRDKFPDMTERDVWDALEARSPEAQARASSEVTRRIREGRKEARLLSEIDDLEQGIVKERSSGKSINESARTRELRKRVTELRKSVYNSNLSSEQLGRAVEALNKLQDQLANHSLALKKNRGQTPPDLADIRKQADVVRREMKAEDALADLEEQKRTGDYKIPIRKKPFVTPELERLQIKLRRERRLQTQAIEAMRKKSRSEKVRGILKDITQIPRAAITGPDWSGLRQNVVQVFSHPIRGGQGFGKAVHSFFSKYTNEQIKNAIEESPNIQKYEQMKLAILDRDETFNAKLLEKIPLAGEPFKAGNRHMTTWGNVIRTMRADDMIAKYPNLTKAELEAFGYWFNVSTGIGDISGLGPAAKAVSEVFFSPKLASSRPQALNALWKYRHLPRVRAEIAKDLVKFVGVGTGMIYTVAKLTGTSIETDPDSPDWGKIRIGKTSFDIWGGFQQWARLVARIGKQGARSVGLIDGEDIDPLDLVWQFTSYKFAPNVTILRELLTGKTAVGEPTKAIGVDLDNTTARALTTLFIQDIRDAYKEEGLGRALVVAPVTYLGIGVNTYDRTKQQRRKRIEENRKKLKK
jgi:hypothetical protein